MSKPCRDCGQPIEWATVDGRNKPINPDGRDHWLTCGHPDAKRRRIRAGKEPGIFPMSASRLKTWRQCPLAYRMRYVDDPRLPDDPNGMLSLRGRLGNSLHMRQAAILRRESAPPPDVPLEFADDWGYLCHVMDRLQWDVTDASIEDTLIYEWPDEEMTVNFEARLDFWQYRSDQTAVVTDFKSGWAITPEKELKKDLQAQCYALVLFRLYPQLTRIRFQQVHLRHGGEVVGCEFEPVDANDFESVLRPEVGRILREVAFEPNPWCDTCPPGMHPRIEHPDIRPPLDQEEAVRLAAFARQRQQEYRAAMNALEPWCADHGDVGPLGHHEVIERECQDIKAYIAAVEAWGETFDIPPRLEDFVRPDMGKARYILAAKDKKRSRYADLAPEIEPLLEARIKTRFDWHGGDDD